MWSVTFSLAETESFESQKIVTEEPIKQVHDGEQDNISPVEEASEPTEAPSETSTKAEDEILLEDSMVDDSAGTPTVAKNTKDESFFVCQVREMTFDLLLHEKSSSEKFNWN